MCGRYYIDEQTANEIRKITGKINDMINRQRLLGDIHPSESAPVLIKDGGSLISAWQRWGFPGKGGGSLIFNARSETALQKPYFKDSVCSRRAVIPAAWFYEWNRNKEKSSFCRPDGKVMFLAGFYRGFEDGDHFVILTTGANESMAGVHDRMPLVVEEDMVKEWVFDDSRAEVILKQRPVLLRRKSEYEQITLDFNG